MKKIISVIYIFLNLIIQNICNNPKNKIMENNIIYYNSNEFKLFENQAKTKLSDAWEIQKKYAKERNEQPKNWLFFVIDKNYVFTSIFQPKIPQASAGGIWVNSETGDVKEVKSDQNLRYKDAYNGDGKEFFF